MASRLYKHIKIQVGVTPDGKREMREIGVAIKHEANGNEWLTLDLHLEILNPTLFALARPFAPKGSSRCRGSLYDPTRRTKQDEQAAPEEEEDTYVAE